MFFVEHYIHMISFYSWLVLALSFVLLEIFLPSLFFFLSFSIGALCAAVSSIWYPLNIQCSVAIAVSALSFFATTLILKRKGSSPSTYKNHATNVEALIGKRGKVTHIRASGHEGYARIQGELWAIRTHNSTFELSSTVRVLSIEGNTLIVIIEKD